MGVLTAAEIIKEGVQKAGVTYDPVDTRPFGWLKDWLRSVALGWPWPEISSIVECNLLAGQGAFAVGGSSLNATGTNVFRIVFPLRLFFGTGFLDKEITQQGYASNNYIVGKVPIGVPDKASYQRDFFHVGTCSVFFNRLAKENYIVQVPYQHDPAAIYDFENILDIIPWYQNDLTMKQAIAHQAAIYHDGPDSVNAAKFGDDLATMLRNDKLKFGVIDSFNMPIQRNWKK